MVTLTYNDGSSTVSQSFAALIVFGFDPVDGFVTLPGDRKRSLGGSMNEDIVVFNRTLRIVLGVVADYNDRLFLGRFVIAQSKFVTYAHNGFTEAFVPVVLRNPKKFRTEWIEGSETMRSVVLSLYEKNPRTAFPTTGIIVDEDMYLKLRVKIEGTYDSPETFTTNSGKLATADAPAGAYPVINTVTYKYAVIVDGTRYQQAGIFLVNSQASESGGNLTFNLAVDPMGNPSNDGYFYADILIAVIAV